MKEILKEHASFIKQIFKLSRSELITKYKGAALGPAWAVIQPAITIFVYWFAFAIGLRARKDVRGVTFFLFLAVGMIPWFFMKSSIIDGANCFRDKRSYITKMPFPVSTIPTFTLLANFYTNLVLTVLVYILTLCYGFTPSIYNLQIFWYLPLMFCCFVFLSWILAPLAAISKDFQTLVRSIITALFWLSGIIWDPYSLSNHTLRRIVLASPISYFSNGLRNTFLYHKWFFETRYETCMCLAWMVVFAVLGVWTYKRLRKTIPDVL